MRSVLIIAFAMTLVMTGCKSNVTVDYEQENLSPEQLENSETSQIIGIDEIEGLTGDIDEEAFEELQIATELNLLPDEFSGDYHSPISFSDMETLTIRAVNAYYNMNIEPDFSALDTERMEITRLDAAVIVTEATKAAWGEYPWPNGDPKKPAELGDVMSVDGDNIWNLIPDYTATNRMWEAHDWPLSVVSVIFAVQQVDKITGRGLIPLDEQYYFNPDGLMTKIEAVQAVVRLYRSFDDLPRYVSLQEVPKHTIPEALYSRTDILPEASNQVLPAWHGVLYGPKCWALPGAIGAYNDVNYHESDFKLMHDIGLNMVAIYINPVRLGWPYNSEEANSINLVELELLDEAISWAFENELHVQLTINGVVGGAHNDFSAEQDTSLLFSDDEKIGLLADYWRMLAKRYADIPNNYLGFTLQNEVDPPSDDDYIRVFGPAIDAIWEESPGRVIIADVHSYNITGESMAAKGVALSRHQYALPLFDYGLSGEQGRGIMDLYPDYVQELTWPQLYLPSMLHGSGNSVKFMGDFHAGDLTIGINQVSDGNEVLCVRIDGIDAYVEEIVGSEETNEWGMIPVNQEFVIEIPQGTSSIEIFNQGGGILVYNRIKITQEDRSDIILYPHDTYNSSWVPESVTVEIDDQGGYGNSRVITWDDLKAIDNPLSYNSIQSVADAYQVGFIVGEFGPFGEDGLPPDVMTGYMSLMIEGMNREDVGWAIGALIGPSQLVCTLPSNNFEWQYGPIENSPYVLNQNMADFIRSYGQTH